ncbi:type II toxin-antitoxin system VapC family toxin [Thermococcus aciditolerans]|uniref:Type II toxin-antitoxin system VapC family toxin n=1 Tax=Thermococcus aciditolerans TaxID=2598455 RepID=A0A5C0SKZ1_9EURY|nr:type II toxin-antitoxin system VapC family toxin [Thermococcus aciditolerans]QEK14950.1 type II toxin-antitoxin system VapC family toxin [Thermococcus aciditolerans]
MIVVDASVFVDLFFEYDESRTRLAERFFEKVNGVPIFEPELFKIELVSQLVRRMKKDEAILTAESTFKVINFVETGELFELAFLIALETGCKAADSFYIATAKVTDSILVSNDKFQVKSARDFGISAFYLLKGEKVIDDITKLLGGEGMSGMGS